MIALTLYGREECPLCDEMHRELDDLIAGLGLEPGSDITVTCIDIDNSPDLDSNLRNRLKWHIPVLSAGDTELCVHRLDHESVREFLTG